MDFSAAHLRKQPRAFTLVEVICTIAVLAVIGTLSSQLVLTASDQYLAAAGRASIGSELSAAMERIATELRQVPAKPATTPTQADLRGLTPTSFAWNDATGVERTLELTGTALTLSEGQDAYTLLNDVSAFTVQTYDEANLALAGTIAPGSTAAVRRVEVSITVTRFGQSETLRARFFLRCTVEGGQP